VEPGAVRLEPEQSDMAFTKPVVFVFWTKRSLQPFARYQREGGLKSVKAEGTFGCKGKVVSTETPESAYRGAITEKDQDDDNRGTNDKAKYIEQAHFD
jgi:hypothetical protein